MADKSNEYGEDADSNQINFTFEDEVEDEGDDYGYQATVTDSLAAVEAQPTAAESKVNQTEGETAGTRDPVEDEIDYNDSDLVSAIRGYGQAKSASPQEEVAGSVQQAHGEDEIDYDEDDFGAEVDTGPQVAGPGHGLGDDEFQEGGNELSGENDLGFEQTSGVDSNAAHFHTSGYETLQDDRLAAALEDMPSDSLIQDEINDHTFGNGIDDEDEGFDPSGFAYASYPPEVLVTWGDEVCPLFKKYESDDPESFYLDDVGALELPLSSFLAAIRSSISKWVKESDEIHLRINELGIEFGETTTDALLSQSTFGQFIALHTMLLKNEDPTAIGNITLTLTTRPNCAQRIKELVEAANNGQGLSSVQAAAILSEESSHSPFGEDDSPDGGSNAILDEAAEGHSYSGGYSQDMGVDGYTGDDGQDDLIDYEDPDYNEESAGAEEDQYGESHETANVSHEYDEEDATGTARDTSTVANKADGSELLGAAEPTTEAVDEADLLSYGENTTYNNATHQNPTEEQLLDFSGEPVDSQEADVQSGTKGKVASISQSTQKQDQKHGQEQDHQESPYLSGLNKQLDIFEAEFMRDVDLICAGVWVPPSPQKTSGTGNSPGYIGSNFFLDDDDDDYDFLNLDNNPVAPAENARSSGSTNGTTAAVVDPLIAPVTADTAAVSPHGSSTPTLGGDEIDYDDEPVPVAPSTETALSTAATTMLPRPKKVYKDDEIDWDDEDKIIAPMAAALSPASNIPAKRSRDGDEGDGLRNDGHDAKRHRPEQVES